MKKRAGHTTIYIEVDEEITSIISRIKKTPSGEIALIVPRRSSLAFSVVNLKILKSQSERIGKNLVIVTRDPLCKSLAEKAGLSIKKRLDKDTLKRTRVEASFDNSSSSSADIIRKRTEIIPPSLPITATLNNSNHLLSPQKTEEASPVKIAPMSLDVARPAAFAQSFRQKTISLKDKIKKGSGLFPSKVNQPTRGNNNIDLRESVLGKKMAKQSLIAKKPQLLFHKEQPSLPSNNLPVSPIIATLAPLAEKKPLPILKEQKKEEIISLPRKVTLLPSFNVGALFLFLGLFLVTVITAAIIILPKADVSISLKKEPLTIETEAVLSSTKKESDFKNKIIPARKIVKGVFLEEEYPATGKKEVANANRVQGEIVVYNEFSPNIEVFVSRTRFETENGLIFRSEGAVRIPGFKNSEGKIIPGSAKIIVVADKEGASYELKTGRLTVPGLKGGARFSKIYATIESPLSLSRGGGLIVTEEDKSRAKEDLTSKIYQKAQENLLGELSQEEELSLDSLKTNDLKVEFKEGANSSATVFLASASVNAEGLAYKKNDLTELLSFYFKKETATSSSLADSSQWNIVRSNGASFSLSTDILKIKASGFSFKKTDKEELKKKISGLPVKEATSLLESLDGTQKATIECWPFWVRSVPDSVKKINLEVGY